MNQICIMNIKVDGKPMSIPQLTRYFEDANVYRKLRTHLMYRQVYHREHLITWELHRKEMYWLANGVRFDNKQNMAAMLGVNYHSLKSRKEHEWVYAGIVFQKIERLDLYTEQLVDPDKRLSIKERNHVLVEVKAVYDEIDLNGIKLVRKFIGGNLSKTYAHDRGAQYLQA